MLSLTVHQLMTATISALVLWTEVEEVAMMKIQKGKLQVSLSMWKEGQLSVKGKICWVSFEMCHLLPVCGW